MAYAVIRTGGKQYRVQPGMRLTIEKIDGNVGDIVTFEDVLMRSKDGSVETGVPSVDGASVRGVIVRQGRGRKILVYKKKRRKNYRRRAGHRQYETTVEVTAVA